MRLVLMGDFHYSRMVDGTEEMLDARDTVYTSMLDQFLAMDGDVHISLGDLTHEGFPEEFRYVFDRIDRSGRPFIHVLGNHDTYSIPKTEILAITGQKRYSALETDGAFLIFLDSTKEMNKECWGGTMDAEQLEWLQAQLEASGEKPVFVFAHHPVYDTTTRSKLDKLSIHPEIDMKAVLRTKKGPAFYFCGHNHANSIVLQDGWHFIQTAACLDIPAFRVVELKDGQVRIDLVKLNEAAELETHITRFHTNMRGFKPSPDARGEESDWNLSVDLLETTAK
ncbi:metallophosphoesterase family protein [Paenibacillus sedimenti]|uniref:Metallophosphoesterase n=1 Tax=Paenibacillus sedimenti TaxID=2770274 RepID=A0A926KLE2_9BACL|nr:metallophosphoesterase [Paenibacillus sedimenti]MBD0379967.1 metallophosphoesterase [Paenibacillus sedimenti]